MLDLKRLTDSIQHNCHISDAQYAGNYTMCVFLLKMREYYRWEKKIPLSHPLPGNEIGDWLTKRENFWENLLEHSLSSLQLNNQDIDPFDTENINDYLNPLGYVYSGGIGIFHKPYFFLGKLEKKELTNDITLLVSSEEFARDLVAPPAMLLGNTVFIRKESLRRLIWERIDEWGLKKKPNTPMARVLSCYGHKLNQQNDMESILDQITENELESVLLHETGEAEARKILGTQWEDLLSTLPHSKAEFIVRAIRDHLADCLRTLPKLIETNNEASLHFYFANFNGMRKEIFPEALEAYHHWIDSGSLAKLKNTYQQGQLHWHEMGNKILGMFRAHTENLTKDIEVLCQLDF